MRIHPHFSSFFMDQGTASLFDFRWQKRAGETRKEWSSKELIFLVVLCEKKIEILRLF
jgi:hypothetical protein